MIPVSLTRTSTVAGASLTDMLDVDGNAEIVLSPTVGQPVEATHIAFQLANDDAVLALGDFALLAKFAAEGDWITLLSATDWGTLTNTLEFKSGTLQTLAAATNGAARVNFGSAYALKFQAKSGGSTVLSNGTFTGNDTGWTDTASAGTIGYGTDNAEFAAATGTYKQAKADMSTPWTDTKVYEVTFTISGYSAGTLTVGTNTDADQGGDAISANGTYVRPVTADAHADGLVFTATGLTADLDTVSAIPVIDGVTVYGRLY